MPKPKLNRAREKRIANEIVVDAYNETERAMGWYYYLEEKLRFPFKARCVIARTISPLKKGEVVEVIAMAQEDDCVREMFVRIELTGRKLGVLRERILAPKRLQWIGRDMQTGRSRLNEGTRKV